MMTKYTLNKEKLEKLATADPKSTIPWGQRLVFMRLLSCLESEEETCTKCGGLFAGHHHKHITQKGVYHTKCYRKCLEALCICPDKYTWQTDCPVHKKIGELKCKHKGINPADPMKWCHDCKEYEDNFCKYCDGPHKPKDCPQDFGESEEECKHEWYQMGLVCVRCNKAKPNPTPKPSKQPYPRYVVLVEERDKLRKALEEIATKKVACVDFGKKPCKLIAKKALKDD